MPRRAVLVICDGMRADLITPGYTPGLARLREQTTVFTRHRAVYPSTTRAASASIATGCTPAGHGLLGNAMALDEGQGLRCLSTGSADFRERLRRATGRTLHRPALPQYLAAQGGAIVVSNASPGAAFFQDPDGFGTLYHRAGSHRPGLKPLPASEGLKSAKGNVGDAAATDRFCEEILTRRRPALAVLWLSEPDNTGHRNPLAGPAHREAMAGCDRCVTCVVETLQRLGAAEETLLLVGSDHGQETTRRVIPIEALLVEDGLKQALDSSDVVVAPQGTSALIFLADETKPRLPLLLEFLRSQDWVGEISSGRELARLGLPAGGTLAAAVSMRKAPGNNAFGVPGLSDLMLDRMEDLNHLDCGQHGGLGPYEQQPFLLAMGGGFAAGVRRDDATSLLDIAPTILAHLGVMPDRLDGKPLQKR